MALLGLLTLRQVVRRVFCPKLFDLLLAISIASWGAGTILRSDWHETSLVRLSSATVHMLVAIAFVARRSRRPLIDSYGCVAALPSFVGAAIASQLAPHPLRWGWVPQVLFASGASLAGVSLCHLGRSFAVLPQGQPLVARGVYNVVRHPMYLGESLMIAGCCVAHVTLASLLVLMLSVAAIGWRIQVEEARMQSFDAAVFEKYIASTRWRLCPMVW